LNANVNFVEETWFGGQNKSILVTNSSSSSTAAEYQFYYLDGLGSAQDVTGAGNPTRNETIPFTDSGADVSLEVITSAYACKADPFVLELPTRWADLGTAATDHIDLFITSDTALTDSEVWAEATYPDGTSKHIAVFAETRNSEIFDAAGTELTADVSSTWTNGKTNDYTISIDTTKGATVTGLDCVPVIKLYVGRASTTLYIDTTVELSAS
jgi:hypothetical protein